MANNKISVSVMWRPCKGGKMANLQVYNKGLRSRTSLGLVLLDRPTTPIERANNSKVKQIAEEKKNELYLQLLKGCSVAEDTTNHITLFELIEEYAKRFESLNTKKNLQSVLSMLNKIGIKDKKCSVMCETDVQTIVSRMKDADTISHNSKVHYLNRLFAVLKWGIKTDRMKNIIKNVDVNLKNHFTLPYTLTKQELSTMYADTINEQNTDLRKVAFMLSALTGLRYSDLFALTWKDIHDGRIEITMQKTKEPVIVPISKKVEVLLSIIPTEGAGVLPCILTQRFSPYLKNWYYTLFGIKNDKIHFHTARHTFATLALESGADLPTIQKLLGHKNINTTTIYTEITDKRKQDTISRMDEYLQ